MTFLGSMRSYNLNLIKTHHIQNVMAQWFRRCLLLRGKTGKTLQGLPWPIGGVTVLIRCWHYNIMTKPNDLIQSCPLFVKMIIAYSFSSQRDPSCITDICPTKLCGGSILDLDPVAGCLTLRPAAAPSGRSGRFASIEDSGGLGFLWDGYDG